MDAETVRDSLLAVAGRLDARLGGASLDDKTALATTRRSLYYRHTPQDRAKFLELFDGANPEACYLRNESVMPQQALALLNSPLAREQAKFAAERVGNQPDDEFVAAAFRAVLGREPNQAEKEACGAFLREQPSLSREHVRASLVHTLFNHNDFVTIR
jgi:hypothetical protein